MAGSAVCIGNFDGVHAGHRKILKRAVDLSKERGWTPTVLTFEPHPTKVVAPARAPLLLHSTAEKIELLRGAGIENVVVQPFNAAFAALSPEEFARDVLVKALDARVVLVGDNFRYGSKQAGDVATLRDEGTRLGFDVEVVGGVFLRGRMVSSSEVRRTIRSGNVSAACRLLGRPYWVQGDVVRGHGIGSKQTVPTLNLATEAELLPAHGVYITRTGTADRSWNSITNIGMRPTFDGDSVTIETFLLSPFDGKTPARIRVEFLRRVRDERKFANPEELKRQIFADVSQANAFFRRSAKWAGYTGN